MKHQLRYYGDPILREKAQPVEEITEEVRQLVKEMLEFIKTHDALGLAAPQIGILLRIFVANVDYEDENGEVHVTEPTVYINPVLKNHSEAIVERTEGCLSVPKLYLAIPRPLSVTVEAMDINGNRFTRDMYGYAARNIMHENDHLNGVLFFDWLKGKRRTQIDPQLRLIKQKYYKKS